MNITGVAIDENGNPLANVQITAVIDGTSYNVATDGMSVWILSYTPLTEDLFDLSVSWVGNSTHNCFTNSTAFSVPKVSVNTTINVSNTKVRHSINVTGVATSDNGDSLANATFTITINSQSFNVVTDSNGNWILTFTPINAGIHNVIVNSVGNNTHLNFTNSTSFNVEKLLTNISINIPNNVKVNKEITISGVLTN